MGCKSLVISGVIAVDLASWFGVLRTAGFVGVPVIAAAKDSLVLMADGRVSLIVDAVASLILSGV